LFQDERKERKAKRKIHTYPNFENKITSYPLPQPGTKTFPSFGTISLLRRSTSASAE